MSDQIDISATGIEAAWQDFCEAGSATGNSGDIDLYDIDGMFETAQAMHELTVALRAALDAAESEKARAVEAERAVWVAAIEHYFDATAVMDVETYAVAIRTGAKP